MNKFSDSLGPPSVRTNNFRQLIRKCLTLALPVQTSPTAHLHLHHHGGALHGEILKMTEVSAVPTCRRRAASGTGAYFRSHRRHHPTIAVSLDPKNPHVRPGSPIHVLSHARLSARRPIKPTSTESEADPVNLRLGQTEFSQLNVQPDLNGRILKIKCLTDTHVETLKAELEHRAAELETRKAQLAGAEARAGEEAAKTAQAIAAFASLAERLEAIAQARRPWWRLLLRRAG